MVGTKTMGNTARFGSLLDQMSRHSGAVWVDPAAGPAGAVLSAGLISGEVAWSCRIAGIVEAPR